MARAIFAVRPTRIRFSLLPVVAAMITFGMTKPLLAESASADLARFAMAEAAEPAPTSQAPADPPKDALHDPAANSTPVTSGTDARSHFRGFIEKEAAQNGIAPEIVEAVMGVESGYNPAEIGAAGEIGLMQIMPPTARLLGFGGTMAELADPATNIHYGTMYLAQAWRLAGGDLCTATMKYRAGHGETRFSFLSVNYCLAVRAKLRARGFPVTGSVPVATFGEAGRGGGGGGCGRKCVSIGQTGHVNLAALNSQLSAIVVQVRSGH
jgi:soluble lytic murein transglycosylase-like protein